MTFSVTCQTELGSQNMKITFKEYLLEGDVVSMDAHKFKGIIDNILKTSIKGNAHADGTLMQAIHEFVLDPKAPMAYKIKAIEKLDAVMGQENPTVTAKYVEEYIKGEG